MGDELLQLTRANPPAVCKLHRREGRKLVTRETEKLEAGAAALERHPLLATGADLHRCRRQLTYDLSELLRRNGNGTLALDIRGEIGTHRHVQICPGESDPTLGSLDQDISQNREGGLRRYSCRHRGKSVLQLLASDGEAHSRSSLLTL